MRRIILSVPCPSLSYFSILSHKRYDFRNTSTESIMHLLISSTKLSETFLILCITDQDYIINVYKYACQVAQIPNLIKNHLLETHNFRADKRRDRRS